MRELIWGSWNAICDRCGFKYKSFQLRKEWTGLMVCKNCWEPRHPQDLIKIPKDDQSVPWSRPEQNDVFVDVNYGKYLYLPGTNGNYATTPDSVANSITGDIDIRVKAAMNDWTPSTSKNIITKGQGAVGQLSYLIELATDGRLNFFWSVDGTASLVLSSSTAVNVIDGAIKWIRVTFDIDNGAAGRTATFYTSNDGITWNLLGIPQTSGGVTSIFDGNSVLALGANTTGSQGFVNGFIYYADIRNIIDGTTPVVKFDPSNDAIDLSNTFTSSTNEIWTINQSGTPKAELKYTNLEDSIPSGNFTSNNETP